VLDGVRTCSAHQTATTLPPTPPPCRLPPWRASTESCTDCSRARSHCCRSPSAPPSRAPPRLQTHAPVHRSGRWGSFWWYRPGLCQCRFRLGGLYRAFIANSFFPASAELSSASTGQSRQHNCFASSLTPMRWLRIVPTSRGWHGATETALENDGQRHRFRGVGVALRTEYAQRDVGVGAAVPSAWAPV
jgi:hypothetical protein